jgi:hypothetical protein
MNHIGTSIGAANTKAAKPKTLLRCPSCGRVGIARWVRPDTHRQCDLFSLSSGFASIDHGTKEEHYFACQRCREAAIEQSAVIYSRERVA